MHMFLGFDPVYFIFALPALAFVMWAQFRVRSTYARMSQVGTYNQLSGAQVARILLDSAGLGHVTVERVPGELSDHYDPSEKVLRLSDDVYAGRSVAAAGIVAHECGHALQDKVGYAPLKLRSGLVPVANIGSNLGYLVFISGLFLAYKPLAFAGIVMFSMAAIFALITLPVEFDASSRALKLLRTQNLLVGDELQGAERVLRSAALTYVAALAQVLATLLYLVFRFSSISSRDD